LTLSSHVSHADRFRWHTVHVKANDLRRSMMMMMRDVAGTEEAMAMRGHRKRGNHDMLVHDSDWKQRTSSARTNKERRGSDV
jgi:hypothetical protein